MDSWLLSRLACPTHGTGLNQFSTGIESTDTLRCADGCSFPIVFGVPVMLPSEPFTPTHESATVSLLESRGRATQEFLEVQAPGDHQIDAWIQERVASTNSHLYAHLAGNLQEYPIPSIPIGPKNGGETFLDIGCGWGRWSLAAARRGFVAVGIDTSLQSTLAAARVAQQLGLNARFVVADSRYLPFQPETFDAAYSYSVLQHFSNNDVIQTLQSLKPLMRSGATSKLHLLNIRGLRSTFVRLRRGLREARGFETRYWRVDYMLETFEKYLGSSHIEIDGFFTQGRAEDRDLFRPTHRFIFDTSQALVSMSRRVPALASLADNLFVVTKY